MHLRYASPIGCTQRGRLLRRAHRFAWSIGKKHRNSWALRRLNKVQKRTTFPGNRDGDRASFALEMP